MTTAHLALLLAVLAAAGCSRNDDKAAAPAAGAEASSARSEAAPEAGGAPRPLRAGLWKTTAGTPSGEQSTTQCIGEGHDPAAEAAKAAPCGKPEVTPVIDGFTIELTCRKDAITYSLAGVVKGDFQTRTTTDLEMKVQAYGASKVMRLHSQSVYIGPCEPKGENKAETAPAPKT
ncbi:hypothetical protein G5B46_08345 [Caulobacter sp. 602-2]|uniref:DUF3617 family protein n=1 Tax=Caulobacter sp. 602-2 TaxID=2710887 RepID=A0A6G4QVV0_9CAUL|nr:DUF3617 family protein [Caulobacter sp. 602-2]NGM49613.1 hypothetical protein [Caulobacter sp. 602-2]